MRWLAGALLPLLAACGGSPGRPAAELSGPLAVFAAASLTDAFKQEAAGFRSLHPAVQPQLQFAGSPMLVTQIGQGAPADVFASADQANMQRLVDAGLAAGRPRAFAANRLEIVVGAGNPKSIRGLADLAAPGLVIVLCAPAVPCGAYAQQALARAGVRVTARSQEQDVRSVVAKVALGEADAGIVYATDVRAAGAQVSGVEIPDAQNVPATYPVVEVKGAANPRAAAAFVDFLLSPAGQKILDGFGFGPP